MTTENAAKTVEKRQRDDSGRFVKTSQAAPTSTEVVLSKDEFDGINLALAKLDTENHKMSERLLNVDLMIDQRGWSPLYNYGSDGGLTLDQLKASSIQLREMVIANPVVRRGSQLRIAHVMGSGIEFTCKSRGTKSKPGKPDILTAILQTKIDAIRAQRALFSEDANSAMERAAFTDGWFGAICDDLTKTVDMEIGISQITADLRNPDNPAEIWAYRRVWTRDPVNAPSVQEVRWYYTDVFDASGEKRGSSVRYNGGLEAVAKGKTLFDIHFNRQTGQAYGSPDALSIIAWAKLYKEFLVNGYIMSRALAQLAYKVTVANRTSAQSAALQIASPSDGGNAATMGQGNDLTPLNTAGKGYDFDSGRPLAAMIATGLEVSLVSLLSDPGVGGGNTGVSETLNDPAKMTGQMRRQTWVGYWKRVFRYLGLSDGKQLVVTWSDLTSEQIQRRLQAWTLMDNTGLFSGELIQSGMAKEMNIPNPGEIPEGRLLPNNKASLPRKDIDSDTPGGNGDGASAGTGQGQGGDDAPAGPLGNDHSTD